MKWQRLTSIVATAAALIIVGCGGGGGGGGGIGGTGAANVSVGTITAFGSVWVNGVEYSTTNATIKRDDNTVTQSGLRVGMVARVDGSIDDRIANSIVVTSAAKGRVEAVPTATQMVVMGQTIVIDSATNFEGGVLPALNDYVEVHGLVVGDGTISAGFIEKKATLDTPPFAVKGLVKNDTGTTFDIGTLHVTLAQGAITSDMPAHPWDGLQVEVKGSTCSGTAPVCGTLTASKVKPEGVAGNIAKVEFEGFITILNPDGFNLGAQRVVTTGAVFDGGLATDVVVGAKVEVEGTLSAGVLTATKVSFRENVRLEGNFAAVIPGTNTFTLTGVTGVTIEVNSLTQFSGIANLAALTTGSHIEVRGRPGAGNNVVALEVKAGSGGNTNRVIVQALASAVSQPNITLLGITMNTTGATYKDINDVVLTPAQFFALAAPNKLIKARGVLSGTTVTWNDEVQLED